jgi:biopolymer transport protein ExbD
MGKHEIPEINAGSMADIAFLLLIFFLVTTTMDKDQAYIRKIPKKVLVTTPPVEVQERNILAIKANKTGELMVRNEIFSDPSKISDKVLEFYQTNEKQNDPTTNYPLYSRVTMSQIEEFIRSAEKQAEDMENAGNYPQDMINFKYSEADEWRVKRDALRLYGRSELPEIDGQANIRIEVQSATEYGLFTTIQAEIEEAIYELRDGAAMKLFGESYGIIKKRGNQTENPEDKQRLKLLEILYPAKIIEVTPKN